MDAELASKLWRPCLRCSPCGWPMEPEVLGSIGVMFSHGSSWMSVVAVRCIGHQAVWAAGDLQDGGEGGIANLTQPFELLSRVKQIFLWDQSCRVIFCQVLSGDFLLPMVHGVSSTFWGSKSEASGSSPGCLGLLLVVGLVPR